MHNPKSELVPQVEEDFRFEHLIDSYGHFSSREQIRIIIWVERIVVEQNTNYRCTNKIRIQQHLIDFLDYSNTYSSHNAKAIEKLSVPNFHPILTFKNSSAYSHVS